MTYARSVRWIVLLLLLSACEPPEAPVGGPREIVTDVPIGPPASPDPDGVVVELLEPGTEPRRYLRYHVPQPLPQNLSVNLTVERNAKANGGGKSAIVTELGLRLNGRIATGKRKQLHFDFAVRDVVAKKVKGKAELQTLLDELSDGLDGAQGQLVLTDRGLPVGLSLRLPRLSTIQARSLSWTVSEGLKWLSTPLPFEEVGEGARWVVRHQTETRGVVTSVEETYTLLALEEDVGYVSSVGIGRAEPQPVRFTRAPKDADVGIDGADETYTGAADFHLSRGIDVRSLDEAEYTQKGHVVLPGVSNQRWVETGRLRWSVDQATQAAPPPAATPAPTTP